MDKPLRVSEENAPSSPKVSEQIPGTKQHQKSVIEDDPNRIWDDLPKHLRLKKRVAYIRRHSDLKVSSNYRKFKLLLWKNYIVTKRRWKTSLLQFLAPTFFITVLVIYYSNSITFGYDDRIYDYFHVDDDPRAFNHCSTIYLLPNNTAVQNFKKHLEIAPGLKKFKFKFLTTPTTDPAPSDLCALIQFQQDMWETLPSQDRFPKTISVNVMHAYHKYYEIRFPAVHDTKGSRSSLISIGERWDTAFRFSKYLVDGAREHNSATGGHPGYFESGFLYIQHKIAYELMEIVVSQEGSLFGPMEELQFPAKFVELQGKLVVRLRRFPFPAHESENGVQIIYSTLPTFLVIGFGISCIIMAFITVREKEMGIKMLLKMYGIDEKYHKYAWIIHNLMFQSVSALCMALILSTTWTNTSTSVALLKEEFLGEIFFFLIVCYIFNLICSVTLLVCFFSRATTACISVCFIWTVSYIPYIYLRSVFNILTFWQKISSCLSCNTAIGIGCLLLAEMQAEGNAQLSWSDVFHSNIGEFSIGWVMVIMVSTGIVELLLALYISRVFPDSGSQKLPWNFLFKSWFWNDQLPPDEVPYDRSQEKSFEETHPEYFEDDSNTKQRKELCIENISKYHDQHRTLHKVNLLCYQGHVTVLLGDQGSGKSSLLKMLNGTMAPSTGTVYLSRKDLYKTPVLSRAFVGYCPSEDLLFPDLTVDETLQFFTDLKGVSNRIDAYEEVERFLRITMLLDFRDTRVCELTKSSQRMLMVATAFCGGSRVVLLDDPTLNLSASQQRVLWDFTLQEKKHRTILVAMDLCHEIDSVVDKIVLLHYGQITAKGSPEFLNDKFGGGYHLELEVRYNIDQEALGNLIRRRINGSRLFKGRGRMLDFYLPQLQTPFFPGLLDELETMKTDYGIANMKVKFVTLEELHLRLKRKSTALDDIAHTHAFEGDHNNQLKRRRSKRHRASQIDFNPNKQKLRFSCSFLHNFREFKLMFLKNLKYSFRHKTLFVTATIAPLLLLTLTTLLSKTLELKLDTVPHLMNYSDYKSPYIVTDINKATNEGAFMRNSVQRLLGKEMGITSRNVEDDTDIVRDTLHEYNKAENEYDVCLLGIEIIPHQENESDPNEPMTVGITGYFNNQPLHTPAVALALVDNILLSHAEEYITRELNEDYEPKGYFLNVSNHPLSFQPADHVKYSQILIGPGYFFGMYTSFCYSFLISSYIIMHIMEQEFRHMQMVFGANKFIFWMSNYLWNMIHFSVVAIFNVLVLALLGVPGYSANFSDRWPILLNFFIFLEVYGLTGICIVGSWATCSFKSWGRGFSTIVLFFIITGPLLMMTLIPMQHEFRNVAREGFTILHNFFLIFPNYSFGTGIYCLVANEIHKRECPKYEKFIATKCDQSRLIHPFNEFDHDGSILQACCINKRASAFSFVAYGIGRNILLMVLIIALCIVQKVFSYSERIRLLRKKMLDKRAKKWRPLSLNEHEIKDYDVLAESAKIYRGEDEHDLTIKNLTLETPVYVKMDNICLEIKKGECFALLGALGSGKSTFLKTLYGCEHIPTYGDVEFHELSLINDFDEYIKAFSYSPDSNPFLNELTGEEVIQLMGALRKVSPDALEKYIAHVGDNFGMTTEIEQLIKTYSFVLVKKLCMVVALLGKFEVLLLDNPTHHLDPKSRQFIISNVKRLMESGCIVIWASHGIEHCESICSKMSILVNGHLKCIGSLSHLKELYEEGFTIIVRFCLDKDMIYFTSKKSIRLENEIRESEVDEETGVQIGKSKHEERRRNLSEVLHEDVEQALAELTPWEQDLCPFVAYFERCFPDSVLVDKQPGFIHYHVHEGKATWSELFRKMEEAKVVAEVDSYYITTTNLDQVFFNFTRGQVTFDLET